MPIFRASHSGLGFPSGIVGGVSKAPCQWKSSRPAIQRTMPWVGSKIEWANGCLGGPETVLFLRNRMPGDVKSAIVRVKERLLHHTTTVVE